MSGIKNSYFTVAFDAILAASPESITTSVHKWNALYHGRLVSVSVGMSIIIPGETTINIPIKLKRKGEMYKDEEYLRGGNVFINGDSIESHMVVEFFDWDNALDRLHARRYAQFMNLATVRNPQRIFEHLAQTLHLEEIVIHDNLWDMKNKNMKEDATPKIVSSPAQANDEETWQPWIHIPDRKDNRQIIELWCKGKNAIEIGKEVFMNDKTIYNLDF